jgi:hypothetical protein
MYADTIEKARELINHPMFGYARPCYRQDNVYIVYYNTPNGDGPAHGRVYAGEGLAGIIRTARQERNRRLTA